VLAFIGFSALGGVALAPWGQPLQVAPQLLRMDPLVATRVIVCAEFVFCCSTLTAAFALRKMRPWAPAAYKCFVAAIAAYLLLFNYIVHIPSPLLLAVAFYGLLAAGLYWGWRIVRKAFRREASGAL
jgi:uncharacterized membrane protein